MHEGPDRLPYMSVDDMYECIERNRTNPDVIALSLKIVVLLNNFLESMKRPETFELVTGV